MVGLLIFSGFTLVLVVWVVFQDTIPLFDGLIYTDDRVIIIFYYLPSLPSLVFMLFPCSNFLSAFEQGRGEIICCTLSLFSSRCRTGRKRVCFWLMIKSKLDVWSFLSPSFNRVPLFVFLPICHWDAWCSLGWCRLGGVDLSRWGEQRKAEERCLKTDHRWAR